VPYRRDVARHAIRQRLFGSVESLAMQYLALERLLKADIFELRYSDLDWAVDRLDTLVREGTSGTVAGDRASRENGGSGVLHGRPHWVAA